MFAFRDKTIYIISPEAWGVMRISKHHYAIELARMGNRVFFFEPPTLQGSTRGVLIPTNEGVRRVTYKPLARGKKYVGSKLYALMQRRQIRRFIRELTGQPDVVWCFDQGTFDDLSIFGAPLCLFHPVDHNLERNMPPLARTADLVFSTSPKILEYMCPSGTQGVVIHHGLNATFEQFARQRLELMRGESGVPTFGGRIGFWGSLFKESLDRRKVLRLISAYPEYTFLCWGASQMVQNNLAGKNDEEVAEFIRALASSPNVKMMGPGTAEDFTAELPGLDVLINIEFEYSARWDNGNPHKLMEYLSTGKPIFSTPALMYADTDLLFISRSEDVVSDFRMLVEGWEDWASPLASSKRISFALQNTYRQQIDRIESHINRLGGEGS
ncbi:MAG: hypothetical protein ACOVQS_03320 [Chitinophagaceae bacterium]|jgi:hypothetical protein